MKISLVTIAHNNRDDIRPTLDSVVSQTFTDIEYIVVDGASTDGTQEIIKEYSDRISEFISEPDTNLYDAINKGIRRAKGEVVGLLHAGDQFYDNRVLADIVEHFLVFKPDICFGHSKIVNKSGITIRANRSPNFNRSLIKTGWMPSHQSIYVRRNLFDKYGYYRTDLGTAADYEWFVRYFFVARLKIKRIDRWVIRFSLGGSSTSNYWRKAMRAHRETINRCWEVNGLQAPRGLVLRQWLRKPRQFAEAFWDQWVR